MPFVNNIGRLIFHNRTTTVWWDNSSRKNPLEPKRLVHFWTYDPLRNISLKTKIRGPPRRAVARISFRASNANAAYSTMLCGVPTFFQPWRPDGNRQPSFSARLRTLMVVRPQRQTPWSAKLFKRMSSSMVQARRREPNNRLRSRTIFCICKQAATPPRGSLLKV